MWWSFKTLLLSVRHSLTMTDGWGEWKQRMLLPLQENPILSISRKSLITPFGLAQLPGHTWWRVGMHCMLSVSVSFLSFWAVILCHLSTVWNLRNMPNSEPLVKGGCVSLELYISLMIVPCMWCHIFTSPNTEFNIWLSNQISLSNWNHSFKNHYNLKLMVWVENKLSKSSCCANQMWQFWLFRPFSLHFYSIQEWIIPHKSCVLSIV